MLRYNQFLTESQFAHLHAAHALTGLTCSEIFRRMLDHCCQQETFNVLFPSVSGCSLTSPRLARSGA